jgi:hypothetical protein
MQELGICSKSLNHGTVVKAGVQYEHHRG